MAEPSEIERGLHWKSILRGMSESDALKEQTILKENDLAGSDHAKRKLLEAIYLDRDREASFRRYSSSQEFKAHAAIIARHLGHNRSAKICEVGAGHGFLAVSLARSGFDNVSILEPNNEWITGTGFISDAARAAGVRIWNDLDRWYASDDRYDCIITKACVHHFQNPAKVAAEIRCKLVERAKWLMFDEFFANDAAQLYAALATHAHVVRYGQYEWPYPAHVYVELMNLAGFDLIEAVPWRYDHNYLVRNVDDRVKLTKTVTRVTDALLRMGMTVNAFRIEDALHRLFRLHQRYRLFTAPQMLAFVSSRLTYPQPEV